MWDDLGEYARRRKAWTRGTSIAAIKDYEELLRAVLRDLLGAFEKRQGESINVAAWMVYTAYVYMGARVRLTSIDPLLARFDFMGEMSYVHMYSLTAKFHTHSIS